MSSLPKVDYAKLLEHESTDSLAKLHDVEFIVVKNTGEIEGCIKGTLSRETFGK
jgi:hypothetical protein